jgi:hypothetical protein
MVIVLWLAGTSVADAQPQIQGFPINISSSGAVSSTGNLSGCTIVVGQTVLAVLAEDAGGNVDARLTGGILQPDGTLSPSFTNTSWTQLSLEERNALRDYLGRTPNRITDAALVLTVSAGAAGFVPVCFRSDDEHGSSGRVNLQINDLVLFANLAGTRTSRTGGPSFITPFSARP